MKQNFFAYGSFSESQVHHKNFSQFVVSKKTAFVKGTIYRLSCGYPMIQLAEEGQIIHGHLYELDVTENFWVIQDELLGVNRLQSTKTLFHREEIQVMTDNYSQVSCQIYCINPNKKIAGAVKIESGDWLKSMSMDRPFVEVLEPRHKEYILKLSRTKGREIVPIKLDLYRELLSMELIVDKGRRLALTKLGKETSLFLQ